MMATVTCNEELYSLVSKARESCAGSNVQDQFAVMTNINDALSYGLKTKAGQTVIEKLMKALQIMAHVKRYEQRSEADDILCEILNSDLSNAF
jgi:hypothetical protein